MLNPHHPDCVCGCVDTDVEETAPRPEERRCYKCGAFHAEWVCPYPVYPKLGAAVEKHRRRARAAGSVAAMDKAARREYGNAVSKAIRALQRSELIRVLAPLPSGKYSPPSITRLLKFESPPRGLRGNPDVGYNQWDKYSREVYRLAMRAKHGQSWVDANAERLGL